MFKNDFKTKTKMKALSILFMGVALVGCNQGSSKKDDYLNLISFLYLAKTAPQYVKTQEYYDGYNDGYNPGYNDGHTSGYNTGSTDGYNDGYNDGYDDFYDAGYDDGYNSSYGDGYDDGYYGYSSDSTQVSRDFVAQANEQEKQQLTKAATFFANKFSLSEQQGLKVAKAITDFAKLKTRTEQDVDAFTHKLYGVGIQQITEAATKASSGDSTELDDLIVEASINFDTNVETMKGLISELHKEALNQTGIQL